MNTITRSPGITTPYGIAGGGTPVAGLRAGLDLAAQKLSDLMDSPVVIRCNSDGRSGGAWLHTITETDGISLNAEVGLCTDQSHPEQWVARAYNAALAQSSPQHIDTTGFTYNPDNRDRDADLDFGTWAEFRGPLDDALAWVAANVRPAGEIEAAVRARIAVRVAHKTLTDARAAANAWWAVQKEGNGRNVVVFAHRSSQWGQDAGRDAVETYANSTPIMKAMAGYSNATGVSTGSVGHMLGIAEITAADIEPGRLYEILDGALVPTKYRSAKVANVAVAKRVRTYSRDPE
jgi:hypothetical protein